MNRSSGSSGSVFGYWDWLPVKLRERMGAGCTRFISAIITEIFASMSHFCGWEDSKSPYWHLFLFCCLSIFNLTTQKKSTECKGRFFPPAGDCHRDFSLKRRTSTDQLEQSELQYQQTLTYEPWVLGEILPGRKSRGLSRNQAGAGITKGSEGNWITFGVTYDAQSQKSDGD